MKPSSSLLLCSALVMGASAMVLRDPPPLKKSTVKIPTISIPKVDMESSKSKQSASASQKSEEPWSPSSWRTKKSVQIPEYPDQEALQNAEAELRNCAPLTFAGEIRTLHEQLALASQGKAFVLFGGDCAESFAEFSTNHVRDTYRVILQMALILTYGSGQPVIPIGRMAGQFAKPRSQPTETIDGVTLPSYQGDNINAETPFTKKARQADPQRMIRAYHQCAQTLNILRAFSSGGYAALSRVQNWMLDFVAATPVGSRYRKLATRVEESVRFLQAMGVDIDTTPQFQTTDFYTAHECLLLPYEEALTRQDSVTGKYYATSAHLLWVGERTRQPDYAHTEFVRGLANPLGVKISDQARPEDVLQILETFNPDNIPGRVTLITRMTADGIRAKLPAIIQAVQKAGKHVVWCSDPVHGNGFQAANGYKTRDFAAIWDELQAFFEVHHNCGSHPGGVHLELTGQDVTECLGGDQKSITVEQLPEKYQTHCDPRLNARQSLELAFGLAELMRERQGDGPMEC